LCNQSIVTQVERGENEYYFTVSEQGFHVYQCQTKKERDDWLQIFLDHGADVRPILYQGVLMQTRKGGKKEKTKILRFI